jgi:dienelactone hydrolase
MADDTHANLEHALSGSKRPPQNLRAKSALRAVVMLALAALALGLALFGGYRLGTKHVVTRKPARAGYSPELSTREGASRAGYDYIAWAEHQSEQPLRGLVSLDASELSVWQHSQRAAFKERFLFPYEGKSRFAQVAEHVEGGVRTETWHVSLGEKLLFRFFKLAPSSGKTRAKLLVFMGHGKISQLLTEAKSYQSAAATTLSKAGYEVYAMENVGMAPDDAKDAHLHLDSLLSLNGYGWYSLLFTHQAMLIEHVLASRLPGEHVGAAGVSTGGFLALTAAALHPEVDAASVHGILASAVASFGRDFTKHCECGSIDGLLPRFDLPSLALMVAPRPLHINNNQHDSFPPKDAKQALSVIEPLRSRLGGPAPSFTSPPGKHSFALPQAAAFFASIWANSGADADPSAHPSNPSR